jgi:RHS repeat-associated protein
VTAGPTTATYATTTNNRMTSDGTYTYTYDPVGNQIEKTKGSGQDTWLYSYDTLNRLVGVTEESDGVHANLVVTYVYDVQGNRVEDDTWTSSAGLTVVRHAYDNGQIWADTDGSNNVTVRYLVNPDTGAMLTRTVSSGPNAGVSAYVTDYQNSIVDIQSFATGALVEHRSYDGYGNIVVDAAPTVGDNYGYTGFWRDTGTGLLAAQNRWYDPKTGRWIAQDPIGFDGGQTDLSQYVGNNPTNATDPSGLQVAPVAVAQDDVFLPFNAADPNLILKLETLIVDGKTIPTVPKAGLGPIDGDVLLLNVFEGAGLRLQPGVSNFPWDSLLEGSWKRGSNTGFHDTDSLQVAVRFKNAAGDDIYHYTNATAPRAKEEREKGANWTYPNGTVRYGLGRTNWGQFSDKQAIPKAATHFDVVFVYTDIKSKTPGNGGFDLPAVVGSFSGDLKDGKWTIKSNPKDVFERLAAEPTDPAKIADLAEKAKKTIKERTGYDLVRRPDGLPPAVKGRKAMNDAQNEIEKAVTGKKINTNLDTGYDIKIR